MKVTRDPGNCGRSGRVGWQSAIGIVGTRQGAGWIGRTKPRLRWAGAAAAGGFYLGKEKPLPGCAAIFELGMVFRRLVSWTELNPFMDTPFVSSGFR